MVAGAARINSSTRPPAATSRVRPQLAVVSAPGVLSSGSSSGGRAVADGPVDSSVDGSAVGSSVGSSSGCTDHGGGAPVTLAGVGSKRTQP